MRSTIVCLTLLLLAGTARAGSDWEGIWTTENGETRTLVRERSLLALDLPGPASDGRALRLQGAPNGRKLHLQGRLDAVRGMARALGREKADGRAHTGSLDAELDEQTNTAAVAITVDGEKRTEKWHRGGVVIVRLEVEGSELARAFDVKRARTGLVVKYRVNGYAVALSARVIPGRGHPYASFYRGRPVVSLDLGRREPGEHSFEWDGRDDTAARRIALGGEYAVILETGPIRDERSFSVEAARFETIGSDWPATRGDAVVPAQGPWNPRKHFEQVAPLLLGGVTPGQPGFGYEGPRIVKRSADVRRHATEAGSVLLSTHGDHGVLTVRGELATEVYRPSELFGHDLKDVHFAFVSACRSGSNGGEKKTRSALEQMIASGCDVAIGFLYPAGIQEADDFEQVALALMARGCPIAKAAIDAGTAIATIDYPRGEKNVPIRGEEMIVRLSAPGIGEDETLWPPRHGCSTN